jgi:hypothetical protein
MQSYLTGGLNGDCSDLIPCDQQLTCTLASSVACVPDLTLTFECADKGAYDDDWNMTFDMSGCRQRQCECRDL